MPAPHRLYLPEILLADDQVFSSSGLLVDARGIVEDCCTRAAAPAGTEIIELRSKALLPGLANTHSHTFQRLFRGRAEGRAVGGDTFWTWREQMYRAAALVSPEDVYDVARVAFLEMVYAGITVVGEFHYLHRDKDGRAYTDPNLLAKQVIRAAQSVGIRICLLRSAYFRAGFDQPPHSGQKRFYEKPDNYLRNLDDLRLAYRQVDQVTVGTAPHSIRAVPRDDLKQIAAYAEEKGSMPLHMHVSEQVGENVACVAEYGRTPVELVAEDGILTPHTTLIHAIHLTEAEFAKLAESGTGICSCPTTERNLGDGIFPADMAARSGIPVAFGSDSQAQIDILEDARQLEYHLRLRDHQRGILDEAAPLERIKSESIGTTLFHSASRNGYTALGLPVGKLAKGDSADFFTVDLNDLSILGLVPPPELRASALSAESLAAQIVFALSKSAIRDVAVQGHLILEHGQHREADEIRSRYKAVQLRFLQNATGN